MIKVTFLKIIWHYFCRYILVNLKFYSMYKKIVPILSLVCSSFVSFAQAPTLTAANFNPQLNDAFITHVCDTTGVLQGPPGANVTWDFTVPGLTTTQIDTGRSVPVASTAAGAYFPTSTTAVVTPTASMTTYGIATTSKLSSTGYYQSATQNSIYSDPMDQLQYPVMIPAMDGAI